MRSVISNLLIAVVVLHAVLGCCMHHSHADESGAVAQLAEPSCGRDCSQWEQHAHCPAGSHQGEERSCHEDQCVFVRPTQQDDSEIRPACVCTIPCALPVSGATQVAQSPAWFLWNETGTLPLPVRSHLAKQVLLI